MARLVYDSDDEGDLPSVEDMLKSKPLRQSSPEDSRVGGGVVNEWDEENNDDDHDHSSEDDNDEEEEYGSGYDDSYAATPSKAPRGETVGRVPLADLSDDNTQATSNLSARRSLFKAGGGSPAMSKHGDKPPRENSSGGSDTDRKAVADEDEDDEDEDDDSEEDILRTGRRNRVRNRVPQILMDSDDGEGAGDSDDDESSAGDDECEGDVDANDERCLNGDEESFQSFHDAASHRIEDSDTEAGEQHFYDDDHDDGEESYESDFVEKDGEWDGILSYSPPNSKGVRRISGSASPDLEEEDSVIALDSLPSPDTRMASSTMSRRTFNRKKKLMAANYLDHMEDQVNFGRIWRLTEATGGIKIIWNKRLLTTAGRARGWRKGPYDGALEDLTVLSDPENKTKYHAEIELSEKVIDSPQKIADTMAHEYAHLCVMLLHDRGSGGRNQAKAHGREFRHWGRKITNTMGLEDMGRCHNYEIEYKYHWACKRCHQLVKRHSKSFDTSRYQCKCGGRFTQVKPAVSSTSTAGGSGSATATSSFSSATPSAASKYNQFYKDNFKSVRKDMGLSTPAPKVMAEVARRWRALQQQQQERGEGATVLEESETQKDSEIIEITDEISIIELSD